MNPTMFDSPPRSSFAAAYGMYPILAAASRIRFFVASPTRGESFNALETVACETPSSAAMSLMVGPFRFRLARPIDVSFQLEDGCGRTSTPDPGSRVPLLHWTNHQCT